MLIEIVVILAGRSLPSFFLMKKKGEACRDFDSLICPIRRFLSTKVLQAFSSAGFSRYSLATLGVNDSLRLMAWSKLHCRGRASKVCSEKTSAYIGGVLWRKCYFFLLSGNGKFGRKSGFLNVFIIERDSLSLPVNVGVVFRQPRHP